MGIPLSTKIGEGFAQVMDTRRYAQEAMRIAMFNKQQERTDRDNLARLLTSVKADGVRAADLPDWNQKLQEWKDVYLKNPGLHSNPTAHLEDYKKANRLYQELGLMAQASKQYADKLDEGRKEYRANKEFYEPQDIEKFNEEWDKPMSKSITDNNGDLYDPFSVRKIPKQPKWDDKLEELDVVAERSREVEHITDTITREQDKDIPLGQIKTREIKKYKMPAVVTFAQTHLPAGSNDYRYYAREFNNLQSSGKLAEKQAQLNEIAGNDTIDINSPESLAAADIYILHGMKAGEYKLAKDEKYERQQAEEKRKLDMQDWKTKNAIENAQQEARQLRGFAHDDAKEKKPKEDIHTDVGRIAKLGSLTTGSDITDFESAIVPLFRMGLGLDEQPKAISPYKADGTKKSMKEYNDEIVQEISVTDNDGKVRLRQREGGAVLSQQEILESIKNGTPLAIIKYTQTDEDGKVVPNGRKAFVYNPTSEKSNEYLKTFVNKGGAVTQGLMGADKRAQLDEKIKSKEKL